MPSNASSPKAAGLIPGLVVLKLAQKASEQHGLTGTADHTQPTFTRISTIAPSSSVQLPIKEQLPQSSHDQQDLQQTWHDQHVQQQLATSERFQQRSNTPSFVHAAMQDSPSRIPVAPVSAGSPKARTAAGPAAVRCRTPHPARPPAAAAAGPAPSVTISAASKRATASEQSPGLPVLGHASPYARPSAVPRGGSPECSGAGLRSSTDKLSSLGPQCTTHAFNSNSSSPTPGSEAQRPGTPTSLSRTNPGSRSNSPKPMQSPRRATRGSPTPGGAQSSNSPNKIHLHPSVAALLGPAGAVTPAMQQHKDRRRAELYALNAVLAKSDQMRAQSYLDERRQQQQSSSVGQSNGVGEVVRDMNHGV